MISIEFHTASKSAYLVDVVNQRIKQYLVNGTLKEKVKWKKYQELQGTGELGKPMVVVWPNGKTTPTTAVTQLKFVK